MHHFGKRTDWKLKYFLIYVYLNILAQSQILRNSLYNEQPKMKRGAWQKSSLFLRKGLLFCRASLFIFDRSLYVTALVLGIYNFEKSLIFMVPEVYNFISRTKTYLESHRQLLRRKFVGETWWPQAVTSSFELYRCSGALGHQRPLTGKQLVLPG